MIDKEIFELINSWAANEDISLFGKFDIEHIAPEFKAFPKSASILVNQGFADVEYQNIGTTGQYRIFLIFNQRWRNLKRFKSYQVLLGWEEEKERALEEKISLENQLLRSQNDFQKINNDFIAKQSELIASQLKTNEIAKSTNIFIALFTSFAGLWYLRSFLNDIIPEMKCWDKTRIVIALTFFLFGVAAYMAHLLLSEKGKQPLKKETPNPQ